LDNRYALLFIRGEAPIKDLKYDILKHPNIRLSADGEGVVFQHGLTQDAVASISFVKATQKGRIAENMVDTSYELLSEQEVERILMEG
ncbi:MAG: type IV secretory system conjugative DNA transfer family protein, partial [Clostridia bacterium]|nr:type IV secretory system conjugative DNA transfer family protein [Clostridia bacterium]